VTALFGEVVLAACLLALLSASPVAAARITVRSGEHPTFARLVFDIDHHTKWSLNGLGTRHFLSFQPVPETINLSRIFRFIPKDRLLSVRAVDGQPGRLILETAENQSIKIFEIQPGKLVVDIRAADFGAGSTHNHSRASIPGPAGSSAENHGRLSKKMTGGNLTPSTPPKAQVAVMIPPSQAIDQRPLQIVLTHDNINFGRSGPSIISTTETGFDPDIDITNARQKLIEQLARAMTQGIVKPVVWSSGDADGTAMPNVQERELAAQTVHGGARLGQGADTSINVGFNAATVFNRDRPKADHSKPVLATLDCIDSSYFNLENWVGESRGPEQILRLRSTLLGAFDVVNEPAVQKLAKVFIVNGFGVEARMLVEAFTEHFEHPAILIEMAELFENGRILNGDKIAKQAGCPGLGSLWAYWAATPKQPAPDKNILKQFADLPIDLRRRIAAPLMARLINDGNIAAAIQVHDLTVRAAGQVPSEIRYQLARIDIAEHRLEKARKILDEVIKSRGSNSDNALIFLIKNSGDAPEDRQLALINLANSRAFQLRFSVLGNRLRREELLFRAKTGNQRTAFAILKHEAAIGALNKADIQQIAAGIFLSFDLKKLGVSDFTTLFFENRQLLSNLPNMDKARLHIAMALQIANLPAVALPVLAPLKRRGSRNGDLLTASSLLDLLRPNDALTTLRGLRSPGADKIR